MAQCYEWMIGVDEGVMVEMQKQVQSVWMINLEGPGKKDEVAMAVQGHYVEPARGCSQCHQSKTRTPGLDTIASQGHQVQTQKQAKATRFRHQSKPRPPGSDTKPRQGHKIPTLKQAKVTR